MANILYRKQKQQKSLDNGVTWIDTGEYRVGDIIENPSNCTSDNTKQCRWVELDASEGYYCDGYSKYTMQVEECTENGLIWTRTGNSQRGNTLIESNSTDCGYKEITIKTESTTYTTGYSMNVSSLDEKYIIGYDSILNHLIAVYDNKYYYRPTKNSIYTYDLVNKEKTLHQVSTPTSGQMEFRHYDITHKVLPNKIMLNSGSLNLDTLEYKEIGKYFFNSPTTVVVENTYQESYSLYDLENDTVEELELYYEMTSSEPSSENQIDPEYPKECFKECIVGEDMGRFKKGDIVYVRMRYNDTIYILGEKLMVIDEAVVCTKSKKYDNALIKPTNDYNTYNLKYSNGVITRLTSDYWDIDKGYFLLNDKLITNGYVTINIDSLEEVRCDTISLGDFGFFSNYRAFNAYSNTSFAVTDFNNLTTYRANGMDFNLNGRGNGLFTYTYDLFKYGEPNPFTNETTGIDDGNRGFSYGNRYYTPCVSYACRSINIGGELFECSIDSIYLNMLNGNFIICLYLYEKYNNSSYLFLDIPAEEFIKCTNLFYMEFNI